MNDPLLTCHHPEAIEPRRFYTCPDCRETVSIPLELQARVIGGGCEWARVAVEVLGPDGETIHVQVRRRDGCKIEGAYRGSWGRFQTELFDAAWSAAKDGL